VVAIVGDAVPAARRGQALVIVMGAFSVASVFGASLGQVRASPYSWQLPFVFLGSLSLVLWAVLYRALPDANICPPGRVPCKPH
jgi:predicted MFS family arabinose efflux permease